MKKWNEAGYLTSVGIVIGTGTGMVVALTVGTAFGYDDPIVLMGLGLIPGMTLGAFAGDWIYNLLRDVHDDAVNQARSVPSNENSLPSWWPTDEELEAALRAPASASDPADATIIVPSPRSQKKHRTEDL
jgi:hypothetical protein